MLTFKFQGIRYGLWSEPIQIPLSDNFSNSIELPLIRFLPYSYVLWLLSSWPHLALSLLFYPCWCSKLYLQCIYIKKSWRIPVEEQILLIIIIYFVCLMMTDATLATTPNLSLLWYPITPDLPMYQAAGRNGPDWKGGLVAVAAAIWLGMASAMASVGIDTWARTEQRTSSREKIAVYEFKSSCCSCSCGCSTTRVTYSI